ncbi:carbohydrate ABC transporter permease [Enterococcus sp. MJM12]|uniref:Carbohydrate ABC transporter permease n=1 Tax=Candidatus Enterococcus myersii TaxID=2815322 RepID=A0ABS3H4J4_9ENTE|nr:MULTISPECIES: carbohydrate ABC transporter permease [Enterococcus]MBO0447992.1 carbohydrate ABC transporter permease [Enterococcus sp. MJM12]MDT2740142.1 carbohydrate ABC transporter permease [Enterococcus canintestini]WHA08957.1 carbohydrate ABC transporter permease [Enterococcus montenegrensis]
MKNIRSILLNVVLLLLALVTIIPFIWMLVSSFAPNSEIVKITGSLFPTPSTFQNYIDVQEKFNFMRMFANSLFVSVLTTVIIIYTSSLMGFVFAKFRFKGKNLLFGVVLSTMMLPWAVTIIPKYEMMVDFGWLNTYKALIIPSMVSGFGIFMFRQAISQIPDELIEAARVDGASDFYIFHRIILPMSQNAIASLAIFQFLWSWEDFLWPYLMINDESKQLLSVGLRLFNGQYGTDYGGLFAATAISIIPVVVIYIVFQKRFIAGVSSGAIK